jgi:nitrogen fixation/metabolism regulation signal transduction histidine kinase
LQDLPRGRGGDRTCWSPHRLGERLTEPREVVPAIDGDGAQLTFSDRAEFDKWLPWILLINICGLLTLFVLLAGKLTRLVRDYRRHVPGSRLKGRTVAIFSALAVAPILVVYYFSLQFINRGIDSWFELEVSQGLKDTRELSHAALEVRVREFLQHTQVVAHTLSASPALELIDTLDRERRESTALEFTIVGAQAQILGTSSDRPMDALPVPERLRIVASGDAG